MPYANIEDRRAHHRAYQASWKAANAEKQQAIAQRTDKRRRLKHLAQQNERLWRARKWEEQQRAETHGSIVNLADLVDPLFIFEFNGRKQRETLHQPLPAW